jgi:hypothetical protein
MLTNDPSRDTTAEWGIYTLANDLMVNQLIALLNSLEAHVGAGVPVYVLPYDDDVAEVRRAVAGRANVAMYDDPADLARWDSFARAVWESHPHALRTWEAKYGRPDVYRLGMHRKFMAFDGPCRRFVFLDADMLVLDSLAPVLGQLDRHDFVVYDDQYKAPRHVYDLAAPRLAELFGDARVRTEVFCAGFFASKRGLFDGGRRGEIVARLRAGDAEVLYLGGPDQTLLNYMTMALRLPVYNFYREQPEGRKVHTCATVRGLTERSGLVYDHGRRLPFLHYIGIPAWAFNRLCDGENVAIPYRDTFLDYRYRREREKRPRPSGRRITVLPRPGLIRRMVRRGRAGARRLLDRIA